MISLALVRTRKELEIWGLLPHEAVALRKSFEEKKYIPGLEITETEVDPEAGDS
jgi:hypothetical protein